MAGALAAGGSVLSTVLGALSNQKKSGAGVMRPVVESHISDLSAAEKKKLRRLEKEIGRERLYNLLMQPEVLGLIVTLGGMFAANNIPFSTNKKESEALQAIGVTASVLLGLGYAGVGDLTTLIIAITAGGLSGGTSLLDGSGFPGLGDSGLLGSGALGGQSLLEMGFEYSPVGQLVKLFSKD